MVWAGEPFARLVEFTTGAPTGALVYSLTDDAGTVLNSGSVTVAADQISYLLIIDGTHNAVTGLFAGRTLSWYYPTATGIVADRTNYRVDSIIPYPVTNDGARAKLGLSPSELPDTSLDLLMAYSEIGTFLDLTAVTLHSRAALLVTDAIEAQAALRALPILQITLASKEESGTNAFVRFGSVDWDNLEVYLYSFIAKAQFELAPASDPTIGKVIFTGAPRSTDAVTGSSN